jgi:hypothetical protein
MFERDAEARFERVLKTARRFDPPWFSSQQCASSA